MLLLEMIMLFTPPQTLASNKKRYDRIRIWQNKRANLTTVGQFLGDTQQPYMVAPLIAAPFTYITDMSGAARRLPDPSQILNFLGATNEDF